LVVVFNPCFFELSLVLPIRFNKDKNCFSLIRYLTGTICHSLYLWVTLLKRQILIYETCSIKYIFALDQHAELDFYSASSLKQQSTDRHVATLW